MSHHYSGPNLVFPRGDARLDLTDLFVFPKPGDPGKSILIMDAHPSVGINPPGPTTAEPFAPDALYEIKIDTDGDAVANIAYRVRFSPSDGGQTATVQDRGNAWAVFDNYIDRVAGQCVNTLTPKWSTRLAAFDVYIWDQCYSMEQSLRVE